jgi:hypothetical protein
MWRMKLNEYMAKKLSDLDEEDRCEDIMNDAQSASDFGVKSDRDHSLYFFVQNGLEELVDDTFGIRLGPTELEELKLYVFDCRNDPNYNLTDLVDLRIIVHKWLSNRNLDKTAHPNIGGIHTKPSDIDVNKWIEVAKNIYAQVNDGQPKEATVKANTQGWDRDEVAKFNAWLRYYEQRTPEKYNVKTAHPIPNIIKVAFGEYITLPAEWAARTPTAPFQAANDGKTQKEREIERAKAFKSKMKSRMRALRMLLDKYNDLLPHQNLDKIYEEMLSLEKSVGKLNAYGALEDRVMRSAGQLQKFGFNEGSLLLKEAVGSEDETNLPPGILKANVEGVITKLEGICKELKMRSLIREMSKADIMLAELGLGSYFPEVTEALARMIEGFGYAGNRIEDVVSKLRGSGKAPAVKAPEPIAPAPKLPQAPATPEPLAAPIPIPAPTEKLEPSALHERPASKVQTRLPKAPMPKPGV